MMKQAYLNHIKAALVLCMGVLLTSCEPQELVVPDAGAYSKVFMQAATENPNELEFEMTDAWYDIPLGAGFGGVELPTAPINVRFKIDLTLVEEYNELNGTNYPAVPEEAYQFAETSVTIPAGETSSNSIAIKVNPSKFTGIMAHLLPVVMESADGNVAINQSLDVTYYLVKGTYSVNPYERLDRSEWSIADFSTDENENAEGGRAINAIDGDLKTIWATQWRNAKPRPPHFITIDLGETQVLHGLFIRGRMSGDAPRDRGNPKEVRIETSPDGVEWTYAQEYSLPNNPENEIWLDYTQQARFIKVTVNETHMDFYQTHISEINAF